MNNNSNNNEFLIFENISTPILVFKCDLQNCEIIFENRYFTDILKDNSKAENILIDIKKSVVNISRARDLIPKIFINGKQYSLNISRYSEEYLICILNENIYYMENFKQINACKNAMENANDIMILFSEDGRILNVNKKAVTSYGYTREEILSMNIFQLRNTNNSGLVKDQFDIAQKEGIEFQTVHYRKDGSRLHVEVKSIGVDTDGDKLVLSIIRDISSRMKKEEKMRKLAYIVESSDDAIIGKTLDGIVTSWNKGAEKLYGYSKEEVVGKGISLIIPKEKIEEFHKIMCNVKVGKNLEHHETVRKKKNGDLIEVSITISPVYDLEGNLVGASTIARDITETKLKKMELKEKYEELSAVYEELTATEEELRNNYKELEIAKEEAENANLAKSQFLANMSHEIRTPMNGITGVIDLISLTELSETQKEYLDILKYSSSLLLDIINSILDISKIESGKFELNMRPFNLKKTLDKTIKELSIVCNNKDLKVFYYIDPFIEFNLIGDELRLNQVLINLINNAVKFTEKGEIIFKVQKISEFNEKLKLQFSIKDTGTGIKEEFKKDIFKKFIQQDMSYTKKYYGTGLGLAISKELVKMMNGNIWFESQEGVGSTFYFIVEFLVDYNKIIKKDSNLNRIRVMPTKSSTVLIVEDNEINMKIVCEMLKRLGYNFICAYDGSKALELLDNNLVNLILMDIQMPGLNGYETTKIIRKNEVDKQRIPIVAMTAYAMIGDREMCIENDMDDYISKPFDVSSLENVIKKFI